MINSQMTFYFFFLFVCETKPKMAKDTSQATVSYMTFGCKSVDNTIDHFAAEGWSSWANDTHLCDRYIRLENR